MPNSLNLNGKIQFNNKFLKNNVSKISKNTFNNNGNKIAKPSKIKGYLFLFIVLCCFLFAFYYIYLLLSDKKNFDTNKMSY